MTVNDTPVEGLRRRARQEARRVVLVGGIEARTIEAASRAARLGLARVTFIGDPARVRAEARRRTIDLGPLEVRAVARQGPEGDDLVRAYRERRGTRGLTESEARDHLEDPVLVAALDVSAGRYYGLVAGAVGPAHRTFRTVLHGIGIAPGVRRASSFLLLEGGPDRGFFVFADCGLHPDPTAADLAEIALLTARSARSFLREPPRLALLSFSTQGSADHARTRKVKEAARIIRARDPHLIADGELQVDAALVPEIAARKAPGSPVGGRANVLIFPDRESSDIGSRIVEGLGGAHALGPILQGLGRPANLMSPGATVDDIVDIVVVTALQATEA
jgi:phosphate acetyltransferase